MELLKLKIRLTTYIIYNTSCFHYRYQINILYPQDFASPSPKKSRVEGDRPSVAQPLPPTSLPKKPVPGKYYYVVEWLHRIADRICRVGDAIKGVVNVYLQK